ncbi:hypothetical protein OUZ56_017421 [Daphnia magna]|uniref:Secreted protein n=1 Tax=Daphnia magna TaxID=35525 RepID=A0ABR0AST6_9CRUS|nr:hypothetical protein OUZ56_017421 [Daphnia magna]
MMCHYLALECEMLIVAMAGYCLPTFLTAENGMHVWEGGGCSPFPSSDSSRSEELEENQEEKEKRCHISLSLCLSVSPSVCVT